MQKTIDAAVVVLYNPVDSVFDNIKTYIDHVKSLYIVDNSKVVEHALHERLLHFKNVKVIHSGNNIGIAKALNLALNQAHNDKYKWLMTFDQDTSFVGQDINLFLESFYAINHENIALISPLHNKKFIKMNLSYPMKEVEYVMTSANIVNIPIAREVGGYDEKLFIDEVDHEFCFKLKRNAYVILQNNTIAVNHTLGTGYKYNPSIKLYTSIRLYYMARNYLYIKKMYYQEHRDFFKQRNIYLVKFFVTQIIYGKDGLKNINMIFKGILDYKNSKFGKFNDQ